jgi:sugar phosphate permease
MADPMKLASSRTFPIANAIVRTGGQIGGASAPLGAGLILDRFGWDQVFLLMSAGSLATFLILLAVVEPIDR